MTLHLKTESRRHRKFRRHQANSKMGQTGGHSPMTVKPLSPEEDKLSVMQRLRKRMGI
jgi:hypothetical protein